MPIINGPYRDPDDERPPKRRKAPSAMRELRRQFTYEKQLETFRSVFSRDPENDQELESFVTEYIRELYNSGDDEL